MGRMLVLAVALLAVTGQAQAALRCGEENAMGSETLRGYTEGVQKALSEHGFRPGPADGKAGSRTRAAITAYQKKAKLPVDGCVSQGLIDHLNFAEPKVYAR